MRYRILLINIRENLSRSMPISIVWESFGSWPAPSALIWRPPTDVYETADELIVVMELAGVNEDDMTITLFSDLLVVEGKREQPAFIDTNACHQLGHQVRQISGRRSALHVSRGP